MTQLAQELDKKLTTWRPEVAAQVEQIVTDVIELADTDTLGPAALQGCCVRTETKGRESFLDPPTPTRGPGLCRRPVLAVLLSPGNRREEKERLSIGKW
jgi:hypothetical protein